MIVELKIVVGIQRRESLMKLNLVRKTSFKINFKGWVGFRKGEEKMEFIPKERNISVMRIII